MIAARKSRLGIRHGPRGHIALWKRVSATYVVKVGRHSLLGALLEDPLLAYAHGPCLLVGHSAGGLMARLRVLRLVHRLRRVSLLGRVITVKERAISLAGLRHLVQLLHLDHTVQLLLLEGACGKGGTGMARFLAPIAGRSEAFQEALVHRRHFVLAEQLRVTGMMVRVHGKLKLDALVYWFRRRSSGCDRSSASSSSFTTGAADILSFHLDLKI